jgi:WD40 repeat protein
MLRLTHDKYVSAASLSPDGRTVLTASADGTARLWDAQSGKELQRLPHGSVVLAASFSPDGRTVLTASADKTARLWDAQSGKELQRLHHGVAVWAASFSPDGRSVVTASLDTTARLWGVGYLYQIPPTVDADRLRAWVLVRTGQDFTGEGTLRTLSREEWQRQRAMLDSKGGDWLLPIDSR